VISTVLKSGFGLAPLISGLVGLFSGGDASTPPALVKYGAPPKIDFQAAESGGQVSAVDYDQTGMPRSYTEAAASGLANGGVDGQLTDLTYDQMGIPQNYAETALGGGASADASGGASGAAYDQPSNATRGASGAATQITVNVQAMDARSFLDRSSDIAAAVREAMLNMNSINDVVNDL
jgi:hypothetical protein